jgi:hypothetical protein
MAHHTAFHSPVAALALEPLDPLFFRDGRPFGVGSHRGVSGMPTPRTLAGMLRWHLMERLGVAPDAVRERRHWLARLAVRGPWLARLEPMSNTLTDLFTAPPAHLVRVGKEGRDLVLLAPLNRPLPGWRQPNPYPDQPDLAAPWGGWRNEPLRPLEGVLLGREGLAAVLAGRAPKADQLTKHEALFSSEDRVGVGIDPDRQAAADQLLYSLRLIRLHEHVVFYAEIGVEGDDAEAAERLRAEVRDGFVAPFGGEGRRVAVRPLGRPFAWPTAPGGVPSPEEGGFTSHLVAPACFAPREADNAAGRGVPPHPLGTLVALALGRGSAESGWRLGGGGSGRAGRAAGVPRATRHLVSAGATYFWRRGRNAPSDAAAPAAMCQLAQSAVDRAAGYGLALAGQWRWWAPPA